MNKKKILIVFGTRPEAIKLAPLILKLKEEALFDARICVSAQHRQMLDSVLELFGIVPDYDLSVMRNDQALSYITERVLSGVDEIIEQISPDMLIVHGDTTTTFAAALAGFYRNIPVAHIEAGLRSRDILSPYPEEFNRRAVSLIASYHFAPTERSMQNLLDEGVSREKIFVVGNTVIDNLLSDTQHITLPPLLAHASLRPTILMTVHRREQSESDLESIFSAVSRVCAENPDIRIIFPVHKNPKISMAAQRLQSVRNIILTPPLSLGDFHYLLKKCLFVLTDSGGIQEEAAYLGKPALVLRRNTERPEGELNGTLKLIGSDFESVYQSISTLLHDKSEYDNMAKPCYAFGDGHTSERIVDILKRL